MGEENRTATFTQGYVRKFERDLDFDKITKSKPDHYMTRAHDKAVFSQWHKTYESADIVEHHTSQDST